MIGSVDRRRSDDWRPVIPVFDYGRHEDPERWLCSSNQGY